MSAESLGPDLRARVQRVLDREAQRLLDEGYARCYQGHLTRPPEGRSIWPCGCVVAEKDFAKGS